ncbi:MAG: hypothetical protein RLP11_10125 [Marinoscillum sp.]|uniref:hypothetical protein n=1 Tax=Marinoscillum sp. TaxID=2024838 RepID=UPI0032F4EE01
MKRLITLSLITFLGIMIACDTEEPVSPDHQSGLQVETINPYTDPQLMNILNAFGSGKGRIASAFGEINMDSVIKLANYDLGITNYTFGITDAEAREVYFDNLIVKSSETENQAFVIRIKPEINVANTGNILDERYTGKMEILDLTGNSIGQVSFENGEKINSENTSGRNKEYMSDCYIKIVYIGGNLHSIGLAGENCDLGGGGGIYDDWDGSDYTGGNEGDSGGGGSGYSGGGGGGSISDGSSGTTDSGTTGVDQIAIKPISVDDYIAKQASLWQMMSITLSNAFKNDPCAMSVFDALNENQSAWRMLAGFLGERPTGSLSFRLNSSFPNPARTIKNSNEVYIEMNPLYFNAESSLSIMQAMLHEYLHAELFSRQISNDPNIDLMLEQFADSKDSPYHNIMIDYVELMGIILYSLDGGTFDLEYYEALAYRGLEQTDYYNTEIRGSAEETIIKSFQQQLLSGRDSCK